MIDAHLIILKLKTRTMFRTLFPLAALLLVIFSCDQESNKIQNTHDEALEAFAIPDVLTITTPLFEGLLLPIGTKVDIIDNGGTEVEFELPDEYRFLLKNRVTGEVSLGSRGGYRCTCSASGACTVVYNDQAGFGCLHNSCSGTCSGTIVRDKPDEIVGVINTMVPEITVKTQSLVATFTPNGEEAFFDLPAVANQVKDHYNFVYENMKKPDFELATIGGAPPNGYEFIQVYLYGHTFAMLVPQESGPDIDNSLLKGGASCTANGCTCEYKKTCRFGYCVYTCTGCDCTLHIPEE